eukprot:CAMPEP_0174728820 /NCGR_PEP_ID=MMETSP1094-20130205/52483_1 /TAXON_ID=156173 /ORGANISM="Chrysochromulina brevifilum, Strain UTEX LB 985" /LENGTH=80 /DNA_ID=CAMNT_0015930817 /DNA_START=513 /DNA_END=752 /DNA_ORIENTATION=-
MEKAEEIWRRSGATDATRHPVPAGMIAPPKTRVTAISPMHNQKPPRDMPALLNWTGKIAQLMAAAAAQVAKMVHHLRVIA